MATKKKNGVTIKYVKDPYNKLSLGTVATFSDVADQFTNNPNPLYDPSKAPGAVKEVSVAAARKAANKPGRAARGHQKVIAPNRQTLFGGKTLKRY